MSGRIVNHLLFANLVAGVALCIQSLVPLGYIYHFKLTALYISSVVFIVIALLIWCVVMLLRTSKMQAKYPPGKLAGGFAAGTGSFFIAVILMLIYRFAADLPTTFEPIGNMITMMLTAIGVLIAISGISALLLMKTPVQPLTIPEE